MEIQSANRQHPVPQNVMDVEFKLIGELTIRQFSYLVVFGLLFLLTYNSPLPLLFKVPILIVEVLAGISFAFLPYNDITLDKWTVNYIRAITMPRIRIWKHLPNTPYFFTYTPKSKEVKEQVREYSSNKDRSKSIQELFNKKPPEKLGSFEDDSDITQHEIAYLQKIGFKAPVTTSTNIKSEVIIPEKPKIEEKSSTLVEDELETKKALASKSIEKQPQQNVNEEQRQEENLKKAFNIGLPEEDKEEKREEEPKQEEAKEVKNENPIQKQEKKEEHSIFSFIERLAHKGEAKEEVNKEKNKTPTSKRVVPKKLVKGKVTSLKGELIPNAVVIIKDEEQNPRIAVKTNQVGEFKTTTPLEYGKYIVEVIKEGYKFENKDIVINENLEEPINLVGTKV